MKKQAIFLSLVLLTFFGVQAEEYRLIFNPSLQQIEDMKGNKVTGIDLVAGDTINISVYSVNPGNTSIIWGTLAQYIGVNGTVTYGEKKRVREKGYVMIYQNNQRVMQVPVTIGKGSGIDTEE